MNNIEIKSPLASRKDILGRVQAMEAERIWERAQRDVFFNVSRGYLKLRSQGEGSGELIAYEREAGTQPRASDYEIVPVPNPALLEAALIRSLGILGVVEKTRTLYLWKSTRIHLDEVKGLGDFLELETVVREQTLRAARAETEEVIRRLALDPACFLDRPYLELLADSSTRAATP